MRKKSFQAVRGVKGVRDVLPEEARLWRRVEEAARDAFRRYGYGEIKTPLFERTGLFARGIGEATDIVQKEMYTFSDRGGESLTLRPEATAPTVRAYLEHHLHQQGGGLTRLFSIGPMFRYERPQAGRFRQFHQINCEAFGSEQPGLDAEIIVLTWEILARVGLQKLSLELNSLGDAVCRPDYEKALQDYLQKSLGDLCPDCNHRVAQNPLRVLDCKRPNCQPVLGRAPSPQKFLCEPCHAHFEKVHTLLKEAGIPYRLQPRLVRGLDYYTRTAFEITAEGLGAQNAVAGGGRYDGLVESLGGPSTPAIGFAIGIERLVSLIPESEDAREAPLIFLATQGEDADAKAFGWMKNWREQGRAVVREYEEKSLKVQMKLADRLGATLTVIVGEEEIQGGAAKVRDMQTGKQQMVPFAKLGRTLKSLCEKG
jgi:histidyl-tRNA synthetase